MKTKSKKAKFVIEVDLDCFEKEAKEAFRAYYKSLQYSMGDFPRSENETTWMAALGWLVKKSLKRKNNEKNNKAI